MREDHYLPGQFVDMSYDINDPLFQKLQSHFDKETFLKRFEEEQNAHIKKAAPITKIEPGSIVAIIGTNTVGMVMERKGDWLKIMTDPNNPDAPPLNIVQRKVRVLLTKDQAHERLRKEKILRDLSAAEELV